MKRYKKIFKEENFAKLPIGFKNKNGKITEIDVAKTMKNIKSKDIINIYSTRVEYTGYNNIVFDHDTIAHLAILICTNFVLAIVTHSDYISQFTLKKNISYEVVDFEKINKLVQKYNIPILIENS